MSWLDDAEAALGAKIGRDAANAIREAIEQMHAGDVERQRQRMAAALEAQGVGLVAGEDQPANESGPKAEQQQPRATEDPSTPAGNPPDSESTTPTRKPGRRERREFFVVSNKFFDWALKMPPAWRLLWACLHREANGRPGREARVRTRDRARKCNLKRDSVRQGLAHLAHVRAVHVLAERKRTKGKHWTPGRYQVPLVTSLDPEELAERIAAAPRELRRLRPDERRRGMRKPRNPGSASKPGSGLCFRAQSSESGS